MLNGKTGPPELTIIHRESALNTEAVTIAIARKDGIGGGGPCLICTV